MALNKVQIIGNLGRDPELRYMASGAAVCNLRIATTEKWKDKATGEQKEATEWHSVVLYERLAEIAGQYLAKGRQVYVEGKLKTRKWQDKDGQDRYTTEVHAQQLQMLGGREAAGEGDREPGSDDERPAPRPRPEASDYNSARGGGSARAAQRPSEALADMDDDIPF